MYARTLEQSTVVTIANTAGARIRSGVDRSTVSRQIRGRSNAAAMPRNVIANSRVEACLSSVSSLRARVRPLIENARLSRLGGSARRGIRSSIVRRWFARGSEPEAVVIDVRESKTAGPLVFRAERGAETVASCTSTSIAGRTVTDFATFVRERSIRAASAVFLSATFVSLLLAAIFGTVSITELFVHFVAADLATIGFLSRRTSNEVPQYRLGHYLASVFEPPEPPSSVPADSLNDPDE